MSSKPKSFEKFYFKIDDKEHYINEVQKEYEEKNGNISYYKGNMFCPECLEAELSFTHRTNRSREYLSKLPNSNHAINCSYNYDYATSTIVNKYISTLPKQKLIDRLESMLNRLIKKENDELDKNIISKQKKENPLLISNVNANKVKTTYSIRKKSLNAWFDRNEMRDNTYIFYGKVKFEVEEKLKNNSLDEEKFYYLKLYSKNKKGEYKYRAKIYRNNKDDIIEGQLYYIAVIGTFDFNYMQIQTEFSYSVYYRICND